MDALKIQFLFVSSARKDKTFQLIYCRANDKKSLLSMKSYPVSKCKVAEKCGK